MIRCSERFESFQEWWVLDYPEPGPDSYLTISSSADAELKVQRSRFLAEIHPASDETEARDRLAAGRSRYPASRHICYAWRIGHGAECRELRSDAGEPSGTAGTPILNVLRQAELTDCVLIVARYFGGIKLGTGGLARAYRDAASAVLGRVPIKRIRICVEFELDLPYSLQKTLQKILATHQGTLEQEVFSEMIHWRIRLPSTKIDNFRNALSTASKGILEIRAIP